ncbi:hypothetical protein GQ55_7G186800 [Panicum hallii var. hallii]|uniref:Uncharacterized protein n=1 Tax=Panicum hallii var. hallii TaxID=1504633 RepID=A0A2T7CWH1_9POAL|nr:hypothetical protein GQ55_7G186800 [Panicum hallii var. hallii]
MQRGNGRDDDGRGLVDGMQKRRFGMVEILEMEEDTPTEVSPSLSRGLYSVSASSSPSTSIPPPGNQVLPAPL